MNIDGVQAARLSLYLRRFIKIGVLFILFLPLVMNSQFFFPFIVVKNVLFRITVELIFTAYIFLIFLSPKFKFQPTKIFWAVVAFFAVSFLASLPGIGIGFYRSFLGNYERMSGLFHHLHLILFFIVLLGAFRSRKDWYTFFTFSIFASSLMSFLALAQWLEIPFLLHSSGGTRLSGTVGNATFFAAYLIFNLFFLFYFLLKSERFNLKLFAYSYLVFDAYLVISSVFDRLFSQADWGLLNVLKAPVLTLAFDRFELLLPFIIFQVLLILVWIFKQKKNLVSILLLVLLVFELFLFINTQTRGAIIGLFLASILLIAAWYYLAQTKVAKIIAGISGLGLLLFSLVIYQFGAQLAASLVGLGPKLISSFSAPISRMSGLTSLVAFYLGILIFVLTSVYFAKTKKFRITWIVAALILVLAPVGLLTVKNQAWVSELPGAGKVLQLFEPESISDITTQSRLLTWRASWQGWTETSKSFFLGYGSENYYYAFNKYFPPQIYKDAGSQVWFDRAHNIFFDVAATAGLLGLVAYFSILALVVVAIVKIYKRRGGFSSWLFLGLLVAYFTQNLFVFDTFNSEILFYLFLAFIAYHYHILESVDRSTKASGVGRSYFFAGSTVVILVVTLFVNIKTLQANNYIYRAFIAFDTADDYQSSFEFFKKGVDESFTGKFEARQQLVDFVVSQRNNQQIEPQFLGAMFQESIYQLEQSVVDEPKNARHYLWLGTLYNSLGGFDLGYPDKSIDLLTKAVELSPNRPQIYFEIGRAYAFKNDLAKTLEYFQKGLDVAPWVVDSHWNLVSLGIVADQPELVDRELQAIKDLGVSLTIEDYDQMANFYQQVGKYEKVIEIYSSLVDQDPTNADRYVDLAIAYARSGNNQAARQAVNKAAELNPDFAQNVAQFIELLDSGQLLGGSQ